MKQIQHEAAEQIKLFRWAEFYSGKYPQLAMMYHIPNGGSRNKLEAHNLKLQGVKAGVPDIFLSVPSGKYHGLYIEMKYGKNKPTDKQTEWMKALSEQGYGVKVCYSWQEASKAICRYLGIPYPSESI